MFSVCSFCAGGANVGFQRSAHPLSNGVSLSLSVSDSCQAVASWSLLRALVTLEWTGAARGQLPAFFGGASTHISQQWFNCCRRPCDACNHHQADPPTSEWTTCTFLSRTSGQSTSEVVRHGLRALSQSGQFAWTTEVSPKKSTAADKQHWPCAGMESERALTTLAPVAHGASITCSNPVPTRT